MRMCDRCQASQKEAKLTESHAPMKFMASFMGRGWSQKFKIYDLCERCHSVYTEIERQIIRKACQEMLIAHEEYIRQ
jgi:hypothetical protein